MKSLILTDEQHEELKQSFILKIRTLKSDVSLYTKLRDEYEQKGNYHAALCCSKKLTYLFEELDKNYSIIFQLYQN